jgi:hypothetical protein
VTTDGRSAVTGSGRCAVGQNHSGRSEEGSDSSELHGECLCLDKRLENDQSRSDSVWLRYSSI